MNQNMTITILAKDKFSGEMNRIIKDMNSMSSRVKAAFSNVQTKFSNFAKGIVGSLLKVFTAYKAISLGKEILKLGSDSMEVENLFKKTFGSMTDEMNAFGQSLKEVSGISDLTFRNQISKLYTLAHNMGLSTEQSMKLSKSLMQTGLDLASLRNVPIETMFNQLRGGMTGIIKPLREYGINLEISNVKQYAYANGIAEVGKELTQTQKIMARYGIIMQSTANAQGDVADTIEAPANALKRLQERLKDIMSNLGQGFMPLVASVLRMLNKLADWLYIVTTAFREASIAIFGKIDGSGLGKTNDGLSDMVDNTNALAKAQRSLTPMDEITNIDDSKGGIGAGVGGGTNFNSMFGDEPILSGETTAKIKDLTNKLINLYHWFNENKKALGQLVIDLGIAFAAYKVAKWVAGLNLLLGTGAISMASGLLGVLAVMTALAALTAITVTVLTIFKVKEETKGAMDTALGNIKTRTDLTKSAKDTNDKTKIQGVIDLYQAQLKRSKKALDDALATYNKEKKDNPFGFLFSKKSLQSSIDTARISYNNLRKQITDLGGVPKFANGGVVNSPMQAIVGEYSNARSNPEIITPEDKMYNTMVSAFENVLPRLQQPTPQQSGTTILNINGREFAKAIKSDLQYENNRSGASTIIRRS